MTDTNNTDGAALLPVTLKPCPFCGGDAGLVGIRDGFMVACKAGKPCFARGPSAFHGPDGWDACRTDAITAWNTRAPLPATQEDAERAGVGAMSDLQRLGQEMDGEVVREALKPFADKAAMCDFGDDDYCPDWSPFIPVGAYRKAASALAHPVQAPAQPVEVERLREALDALATAEAEYRHLHDLHGGADIRTGRAWDWMRRKGDEARAALRPEGEASRG